MKAACMALAVAASLGGCASLSPDGGFAAVEAAAKERLGKDLQWARSAADQDRIDQRVAQLLARPLTMDDAVQLALLNNRGLQASFAELGIADAERVQALRLPNPGFGFSSLQAGGSKEIDRSLTVNLARLLRLPLAAPLQERAFAQAQGRAALAVLVLAADTRQTYIRAVAAQETVRYMRQVQDAAEASAELARRMAQVGNFNRLQRLREQAFYADAALNVARAVQMQAATHERLTRLLGLWGAQAGYTLPDRLPDLPKLPQDLPDIEATAMAQRLDIQAAKQAAAQTARSLGLMRSTRFINVLELGAVRNSYNDAPTQRGWEISVELPLFDWGQARTARAEAQYMQAVDSAAQTAINARSDVRQAYGNYRVAYDIARHHFDEIVPLRKQIADENLLRYNGMLVGVFDLLADARVQIASVNAALEALRDFWLAQAALDMALIGPAAGASPSPSMPTASAATVPEADGAMH